MESDEIVPKKLAKGLVYCFVIFSTVLLLERTFVLNGAVVGLAEPLIEWATAYFLYFRFIKNRPSKNQYALQLVFYFFILLGFGDFFYSLIYYVFGKSPQEWYSILLTTNIYTVAYILGSLGMISFTKNGLSGWVNDPRSWFPLIITFPLAMRLLLVPFAKFLNHGGLDYYTASEILGVFTTLTLISVAMRVLVSTRGFFWSIFSSGITALVLSDWALRVEKLTGSEPQFGFYEYLYFISLLICAYPIIFYNFIPREIDSSKTKSLSTTYKFFTLLAVFFSLLFLSLSQYGSRDAIRITSIGCVVGCLIAVFVSEFVVSEIRKFSAALTRLASLIRKGDSIEVLKLMGELPVELQETFDLVVKKEILSEKERADLSQSLALHKAKGDMAGQVAHDIRSPLTALNVFLANVQSLPEEHRILAQSAVTRIRDIANNLMAEQKRQISLASAVGESNFRQEVDDEKPYLIASLIESLLSEKRLQYANTKLVTIKQPFFGSAYDLFAYVQPHEFKIVLSNLINNAIEALPQSGGWVSIELEGDQHSVYVGITDNGRGIPEDLLPKLGAKGLSVGKSNQPDSGSGFGLFHARNAIESWGGSFIISSKLELGTAVTAKLPRASPPSWFVNTIRLAKNSRILILDDDDSIHEIWNSRFQAHKDKNPDISIHHFFKPIELQKWLSLQNVTAEDILLIDYQYVAVEINGLEIIQKFNLAKNAILVTSWSENPQIIQDCESAGIRLLPKAFADIVPVSF